MKKFLISCIFVLSGSALWWGLSNTARYSIKKWDAKFESVLNHSLTQIGVSNEDLLSSVNELKSDSDGEYVVRHLSVKKVDKAQLNSVAKELEQAGADVKFIDTAGRSVMKVMRGSRTYQEISFNH